MHPEDRRASPAPLPLVGDLRVDVVVARTAGGDLHLPGTVVGVAGHTVTVKLADGLAALTVATAATCRIVWGPEGARRSTVARPGRRIDDVHTPTTIELVAEDTNPLVGSGDG